jgi:hypothetical protein
VLDCDVERNKLLKEHDELTSTDTGDMSDDEKAELIDRTTYVTERLETIDAVNAPSKAILILTGLGFK